MNNPPFVPQIIITQTPSGRLEAVSPFYDWWHVEDSKYFNLPISERTSLLIEKMQNRIKEFESQKRVIQIVLTEESALKKAQELIQQQTEKKQIVGGLLVLKNTLRELHNHLQGVSSENALFTELTNQMRTNLGGVMGTLEVLLSLAYPTEFKCNCCFSCLNDPTKGFENPALQRMIVCPACGNKRCPKATLHTNACTQSNAPGQEGSRY